MIVLLSQKKKLTINFSKSRTKFCLSLHYNVDYLVIYLSIERICNFKGLYNLTPCYFCLESLSKDFTKSDMREIGLNGAVYDFSIEYGVLLTKDILNVYDYFMK